MHRSTVENIKGLRGPNAEVSEADDGVLGRLLRQNAKLIRERDAAEVRAEEIRKALRLAVQVLNTINEAWNRDLDRWAGNETV